MCLPGRREIFPPVGFGGFFHFCQQERAQGHGIQRQAQEVGMLLPQGVVESAVRRDDRGINHADPGAQGQRDGIFHLRDGAPGEAEVPDPVRVNSGGDDVRPALQRVQRGVIRRLRFTEVKIALFVGRGAGGQIAEGADFSIGFGRRLAGHAANAGRGAAADQVQ